MRNRWCRLYSEILDDPKISQLDHVTFHFFINLLCIATEEANSGIIEMDEKQLAWRMRFQRKSVRNATRTLCELNVLENGDGRLRIVNWCKRQFVSDDISKRVADWRAKNAPVTTANETLHETLHETTSLCITDTDTDTDTEETTTSSSSMTVRRRNEAQSDIPGPAPEEHRTSTVQTPEEHHTSTVLKRLDTESFNLITEELPSSSSMKVMRRPEIKASIETWIKALGNSLATWFTDYFWPIQIRKVGKKDAIRAIYALQPDEDLRARIITAYNAQLELDFSHREFSKVPHPATWLNGSRWEDEISTRGKPTGSTLLENARQLYEIPGESECH